MSTWVTDTGENPRWNVDDILPVSFRFTRVPDPSLRVESDFTIQWLCDFVTFESVK